MQKKAVINLFKGVSSTAAVIGVEPQAVSKWPETLSDAIADRVIAACVRTGVPQQTMRELDPRMSSAKMAHK